ncbi:hypothetical protein EW146_g8718 [Bondarzewia mesenterica]|uniref:Uncharacterized protein n=1 Tax=Bondarzewia mesenterica TaxID=1095465 RepID=A0A4V3XDD1_9AGAM|nr:hypothetical protein EW146_g8718 [Bondarzewia mesenterica]
MEYTADSDNVIRAGLTLNVRDVPNLVSGVAYAAGLRRTTRFRPTPLASEAAQHFMTPPISIPESFLVLIMLLSE